MEKIYMEEENQQKNRPKVDFSVILSFTVALFAIFSLAFFGIVSNQGTGVSYAADDVTGGQPFTLGQEDYVVASGSLGNFQTPIFYAVQGDPATNVKPIFCVENHVDPGLGDEYTLDGRFDKDYYGLIYLLDKVVAVPTGTVTGHEENVRAWIKQTAIWTYLKEQNPSDEKHNSYPNSLATFDTASITTLSEIDPADIDHPTVIYTGTNLAPIIKQLVVEAQNFNITPMIAIANDKIKIERKDGEDFYRSNLISIAATDDLETYSVALSGVEGAYVTDKDGNKLTATGLTSDKQFMVVIPADKIEEKEYKLNITVTGTFDIKEGHYYVAGENKQKVISIVDSSMRDATAVEVPFIGCPDTGMNVTQTIYFVGLIVLLCGVGIIYANAKPIENKQQ